MEKLVAMMPDLAPYGPLDGNKGLLSPIADPIGAVLQKGLSPVGHVTGAIGVPTGEAMLAVKKYVKDAMGVQDEDDDEDDDNKGKGKGKDQDKTEKPGGERIGGNVQNGQNPLGL
ncbi:hypothetical protein LTR53_000593 [Teratosphaeriaceae sp. CCFEE 6253]|nr:hypothetical protein LTR53_000593 [Teratosphaeriaceae sp. CCFEE 6253]